MSVASVAKCVIGVILLTTALVLAMQPEPSEAQERKPNVVWVMTDDQDFRSWRRMPNVRKLAEAGTYFPRTFVTTSQCCPSRASLLTGQYTHNHGVKEQVAKYGGGYQKVKELGLEESALPTWLSKEGYVTAYAGKYMNEYVEADSIPPGWRGWWAYTKGMGNPYRYWVNENGHERVFDRSRRAETDYLAMRGEAFIRGTTRYDRPFFLVLSPFTPHKPYFHAKRHEKLYQNIKAPRYPNFNEEDVSDKPYLIRRRVQYTEEQIEQIDEDYRDRLRGLRGVDEMLGRVMKALEEVGELDNTYVVFTSDNGYLMGEHRMISKSVPYEGSIRVPMVVKGPGVPAGAVRRQMVSNTDWAPTIADWTGATPQGTMDGRSITPLFENNRSPWRKRLLIEAYGLFQFSAVRTDDDKLYAEHREYGGDTEYYNLREDFHQVESKHQEMPADLKKSLQQDLRHLETCSGQECAKAEGF